jgi:hypothetical protein
MDVHVNVRVFSKNVSEDINTQVVFKLTKGTFFLYGRPKSFENLRKSYHHATLKKQEARMLWESLFDDGWREWDERYS